MEVPQSRKGTEKCGSPPGRRPRIFAAATAALLFVLLAGRPLEAAAPQIAVGLVYSSGQARQLQQGAGDPLAAYRRAIVAAGGRVVTLSPLETAPSLSATVAALDALLVPGGADVDSRRYGMRPTPWLEDVDKTFDAFEFSLTRRFLAQRRPVLGICRGEQIINVALGGSLYQDLPRQRGVQNGVQHRHMVDGHGRPSFHGVRMSPDSLLFRLLAKRDVVTNSAHHQAVCALGRGLRVTARAMDGVVEAVESSQGLPLLAVQFHPERLWEKDLRFKQIFVWLVNRGRGWHRTHAQSGS
jgi:putative glutamine amidotransferase